MSAITIVIAPNFTALQHFITAIPTHIWMQGKVIHRGRNELRVFNIAGQHYVVKRYRLNFVKRLLSAFCHSKARKSYINACRLTQYAINTPTPVGYIEVRSSVNLLTDAYYICRHIPYPPIEECYGDETATYNHHVIEAFASFVAELHDNGILHHDLNSTNVRYDSGDKQPSFWLIDTNRMAFADHTLSLAECFRNICRFCCNSPMFYHFTEHYLVARNIPNRHMRDALAAKRRHDSMVDLKKYLKHLLKYLSL